MQHLCVPYQPAWTMTLGCRYPVMAGPGPGPTSRAAGSPESRLRPARGQAEPGECRGPDPCDKCGDDDRVPRQCRCAWDNDGVGKVAELTLALSMTTQLALVTTVTPNRMQR